MMVDACAKKEELIFCSLLLLFFAMDQYLFCSIKDSSVRSGGLLRGIVITGSFPSSAFSFETEPVNQGANRTFYYSPTDQTITVPAHLPDHPKSTAQLSFAASSEADPPIYNPKLENELSQETLLALPFAAKSPITQAEHTPLAKSLKLVIKGMEYVKWTEPLGKDLKGEQDFVSNRSIFDTTITLWEDDFLDQQSLEVPSAQPPNPLSLGTHSYGFCVKLPENLPSSFHEALTGTKNLLNWSFPNKLGLPVDIDPHSRIEYSVMACLEVQNSNEKLVSVPKIFRVYENVPQSLLERGPLSETVSKTFLLGGKGPLYLKIVLPRQVWFADEEIPLIIEIRNLSTKKLDHLSASLKRSIIYRCLSEKKSVSQDDIIHMIKVSNTSVEPLGAKNFDLIFAFPENMAIQTIETGYLFQVRYELKVAAHMQQAFNLEATLPIHILLRANKGVHLSDCVAGGKPPPLPSRTLSSKPDPVSSLPPTPMSPQAPVSKMRSLSLNVNSSTATNGNNLNNNHNNFQINEQNPKPNPESINQPDRQTGNRSESNFTPAPSSMVSARAPSQDVQIINSNSGLEIQMETYVSEDKEYENVDL